VQSQDGGKCFWNDAFASFAPWLQSLSCSQDVACSVAVLPLPMALLSPLAGQEPVFSNF